MKTITVCLAVFLTVGAFAFAQESANYTLREYVLNGGGNPNQGIILTSAHYRATIDSVGEGLLGTTLASPSYTAAAGFIPAHPPPGEVNSLRVERDRMTLGWNPERSVGTYNLYRGLVDALPIGETGTCREHGITSETTVDAEIPSTGVGFFYLVTAKNRLEEEGTKGFDSYGAERSNPSPCP